MDSVLIVDDDVELCKLLAERLGPEGFAIEAVHDDRDRSIGHDRVRTVVLLAQQHAHHRRR